VAKQIVVNPGATLEPRPGDMTLSDEQYLNLSLFARLKRKPSLEKFPGALVLRRYRKGEEIYRQGESGWTAYYVLPSEDVLTLRQTELAAAPPPLERKGPERERLATLDREVAALQQRLEEAKDPDAASEPRRVGTLYVAVARSQRKGPPSSLSPHRRLIEAPIKNQMQQTVYIPRDASLSLDFESLREPLSEGEVFGEMSCMYRTPRGETVVATRDCYVLEMLRNILDQLQKDQAYKKQSDAAYRDRTLQTHARKLSLFADLTDDQFRAILPELELASFEPGQVIFDEHDLSEDVYIIRTGLVRAMKNVTSLFRSSHVSSGKNLCAALLQGEQDKTGPKGKVWQVLPEPARAAVRTGAVQVGLIDTSAVLLALNEMMKSRQLPDAKEMKELIDSPAFKERIRDLPEKRKDWSDLEVRKCNRYLLEALYPEGLGTAPQSEGLPCILRHHSPGEFFGSQGAIMRQARNTTCIADGHPNQYGLVELVRIPGATFRKMLEISPALKQKVDAETAERKKQTRERLRVPVWDDSRQVQLSETFQELGLIQGQKLMLIDLDRCTRCDECVKACVNTHTDGRSRLFLDGPRFGRYLVPLSCRSCLDPVCLMNCPVGSIHRGDNREIIIEDWCIGCGLCGSQCPYGSIQMHDVGIIPENARGWRYQPASTVPAADWFKPGFRDSRWATASSPILFDREFKEQVLRHLHGESPAEFVSDEQTWYFRHEFHLAKDPARANSRFRLEIASAAKAVALCINGREAFPDKEQRGKREYYLPKPAPPAPEGAAAPPPVHLLRKGSNVLAVAVTGKVPLGETLFQLRLDEVRKPTIPQNIAEDLAEDITEKMVTEKAVVCDLCSSLPQGPACVTACPHDAAIRVNARFNFPSK
jgi:Fe-S-cluster-containing hydrogenase component 2/CRP-like cAMP-binding protein